jgi:hypothetical protein
MRNEECFEMVDKHGFDEWLESMYPLDEHDMDVLYESLDDEDINIIKDQYER